MDFPAPFSPTKTTVRSPTTAPPACRRTSPSASSSFCTRMANQKRHLVLGHRPREGIAMRISATVERRLHDRRAPSASARSRRHRGDDRPSGAAATRRRASIGDRHGPRSPGRRRLEQRTAGASSKARARTARPSRPSDARTCRSAPRPASARSPTERSGGPAERRQQPAARAPTRAAATLAVCQRQREVGWSPARCLHAGAARPERARRRRARRTRAARGCCRPCT